MTENKTFITKSRGLKGLNYKSNYKASGSGLKNSKVRPSKTPHKIIYETITPSPSQKERQSRMLTYLKNDPKQRGQLIISKCQTIQSKELGTCLVPTNPAILILDRYPDITMLLINTVNIGNLRLLTPTIRFTYGRTHMAGV